MNFFMIHAVGGMSYKNIKEEISEENNSISRQSQMKSERDIAQLRLVMDENWNSSHRDRLTTVVNRRDSSQELSEFR